MIYHAVIVGGSYAGLAAAMALARSLRNILIIDSGKPCNRFTDSAHNFLTEDGTPPAELAQKALRNVLQYDTVSRIDGTVVAVSGTNGDFVVEAKPGDSETTSTFHTKKILFATGVRDLLPEIPGLAETWGISAVHCPYCHGYELKHRPTALLINDAESAPGFYKLIRNWTGKDAPLEIFTNGPMDNLDPMEIFGNDVENSKIHNSPIARLEHADGILSKIVLDDGSVHDMEALYVRPPFEQHCKLPVSVLGCETTEMGHLAVNSMDQQTTVPGVYAAGDCTTFFRALHVATSQGNVAGAMINHALIDEGY